MHAEKRVVPTQLLNIYRPIGMIADNSPRSETSSAGTYSEFGKSASSSNRSATTRQFTPQTAKAPSASISGSQNESQEAAPAFFGAFCADGLWSAL